MSEPHDINAKWVYSADLEYCSVSLQRNSSAATWHFSVPHFFRAGEILSLSAVHYNQVKNSCTTSRAESIGNNEETRQRLSENWREQSVNHTLRGFQFTLLKKHSLSAGASCHRWVNLHSGMHRPNPVAPLDGKWKKGPAAHHHLIYTASWKVCRSVLYTRLDAF